MCREASGNAEGGSKCKVGHFRGSCFTPEVTQRDWVKWWEARKSHIFGAFKGTSKTPHMNLAETGHSTWAKSDACNLTLVDAARHDVGENIGLEKLLQGFLDGSIRPTGKGPSITKRANTEYSAQMKPAKEYGNEILQAKFNEDPYTVDEADCPIDPLGSHTPTKRGRRKGSKKSKKDATEQQEQGQQNQLSTSNTTLPTCFAQTIPPSHSNRPQTITTQASTPTLTQTQTQTPTPPLPSLPYNSVLGHQVTYQEQPQSLPIMPLANQWGEVNYALSSCSRMPTYLPQNIQLPFPQSRDSFPLPVRPATVPPQANHVLRPNPAPGQVQVALLRNCHANRELQIETFSGRRQLQPDVTSSFVGYCACSCSPPCRRGPVGDVKLVCLALWREREYLTFISIRFVAFSNQHFADYRS